MDHVTSLRLRVKGLSCFEGHLHLNAAAVTTGVTSSADLVILDGLLGTQSLCVVVLEGQEEQSPGTGPSRNCTLAKPHRANTAIQMHSKRGYDKRIIRLQ